MARVLRTKNHWKPKFKVGDVIRRKPLESYNYEQPIQKIVAIRDNLYVFAEKPLALEIWAQDEWELYDTWRRKLWRGVKNILSKVVFYHQPKKLPLNLKHVGRQTKKPGHTLFMYNKATGEIRQAPVVKGSVITEPNCIYRQALNEKNFVKRLKREGYDVQIQKQRM